MGKALVIYRTVWELLAQGLYFQAWMRLAAQAKRAMRRRGVHVVRNGVVIRNE